MVISTSKNQDGSQRKLRAVTNVRAARRQARKIMENKLGKKLAEKDFVHHKDGTRFNNSAGNLGVISDKKKHQKIHPGHKGSREDTKRGWK